MRNRPGQAQKAMEAALPAFQMSPPDEPGGGIRGLFVRGAR